MPPSPPGILQKTNSMGQSHSRLRFKTNKTEKKSEKRSLTLNWKTRKSFVGFHRGHVLLGVNTSERERERVVVCGGERTDGRTEGGRRRVPIFTQTKGDPSMTSLRAKVASRPLPRRRNSHRPMSCPPTRRSYCVAAVFPCLFCL